MNIYSFKYNIIGIIIAAALSFIPSSCDKPDEIDLTTVSDVDGNVYQTITIGTQVWMAENLKTTKYNDNTVIPRVSDNTTWSTLTTPAYCYYDNDSSTYAGTYGALYNWFTVNTGKLCPDGWHVPTDLEWFQMETYLIENGYNYDGSLKGNKIAKSLASKTLWNTSTSIGAIGNTDYPAFRNKSGFSALPGGSHGGYLGTHGTWWTSTETSSKEYAHSRLLDYDMSNIFWGGPIKQYGMSIRCIRD